MRHRKTTFRSGHRVHLFARVGPGALFWAVLAAAAAPAAAQDGVQALVDDPANWPMPARDYSSTRFSELDQITAENVDELELAWTFSIGRPRGQEAAPIVVDGTMYVVGPHPNNLFALDATDGTLKWIFSPPTAPAAIGVACCDIVNRGAAYSDGVVYFNTLDNHTVAVDAETGEPIWHAKLGEITTGQTMTMAPIVVKDKVLVGNSGGELGVRGWITALDKYTGEIAWRGYSTGPDDEVLIGEDFEAPYDWMEGEDLGVDTWPAERWQTGGGTVWGWISYDPERDLIFHGTSNPGPWNHTQRPGDNLWTATIFARDPDTGQAKWAYQVAPHDMWDHDSVNELILTELEIDGEMRDVILRPDRTGFFFVLDRDTGRVISAEEFAPVNVYLGVDEETGRMIRNPEKTPEIGEVVEDVCPSFTGGKDWQPSAWSPETGLVYIPHQHLCMTWSISEVGYIAGTPFLGATADLYAAHGDDYRGVFTAWDPVAQEKVWEIREDFPVWGGAAATAGGVVFYGTMDRWFKAVDAETGEVLWQFRAPSGIIGQPTTYMGRDGRQYVAVLSGIGGGMGAIAAAEIDPRVRTAATGYVGAVQDLPAYTKGGSTLLVFALPEHVAREAHQ